MKMVFVATENFKGLLLPYEGRGIYQNNIQNGYGVINGSS